MSTFLASWSCSQSWLSRWLETGVYRTCSSSTGRILMAGAADCISEGSLRRHSALTHPTGGSFLTPHFIALTAAKFTSRPSIQASKEAWHAATGAGIAKPCLQVQ
jgi:hypothetical protein